MNKKMKVLLVEDVEVAQTATRATLEQINCTVDIANQGVQALELLKKNNYNLVVLDLGLPDTDGFKLAKTILEPSGKKNPPPVAILTIHSDVAYKNKCIELGAAAFWVKPLQIEHVTQLLKFTVL